MRKGFNTSQHTLHVIALIANVKKIFALTFEINPRSGIAYNIGQCMWYHNALKMNSTQILFYTVLQIRKLPCVHLHALRMKSTRILNMRPLNVCLYDLIQTLERL